MSRAAWKPTTGAPLDRTCPHCKALPRSPCRTPSGSLCRKPHAKRHMARVVLSRFATTYGGTGHVRDGEMGSKALCGTAVVLKPAPDDTHVSCSECRATLAYLDVHRGDPLHLRLLPLSG